MAHMFSKAAPALPPAPTPAPPPTMPDPFGPAGMEAQKKAIAGLTGGRMSTILTTAANRTARAGGTIAGGAYSNATLSGAK